MLGLVVLAAFVVSIFVLGYVYSRALAELREAKEAALEVHSKVQAALTTGTDQIAEVIIPEGYTLHFSDNQVLIDDLAFPERGYPWPIQGPELEHGTCTLTIRLGDNLIQVENI